jgi:cyclophilin family peptidyl-prolyl cis-trans isomerase
VIASGVRSFHRPSGAGGRLALAATFLAAASLASACGGAPPVVESAVAADAGAPDIELPRPLEVTLEPEVTQRVEILTSRGRIVVGLYGEAAPVTVANFLSYVDAGFYSGKIFHRVLPAFMIQGGGFGEDMSRADTGDPIRLEVIPGLEHVPGVISMARVASDPHSATSQFFICVAVATQLNGGYAAFGKIEEGYEVAVEISNVRTHAVQTDRGTMDDVPVTPVVIEEVRRLEISR